MTAGVTTVTLVQASCSIILKACQLFGTIVLGNWWGIITIKMVALLLPLECLDAPDWVFRCDTLKMAFMIL